MKVVNCQTESYDVYIGRPSKWGNPFKIGRDGNRAEVIEKYEAYIRKTPKLMEALPELEGKVLGCWCAPKACHGDVLVKLFKQKIQHRERYQPSNGTEGMMFMGDFCERCERDKAYRDDPDNADGCELIMYSMACDVGDPEYPSEWTYDEDGHPVCKAFKEEGALMKPPGTMDLPFNE